MTLRTCDIAAALGADPTLVSRWRRRGMPDDSMASVQAWHAANIKPRRRISTRTGYTRTAAPAVAEHHADGVELAPDSLTKQLLAARVLREQSEADAAAIRLAELRKEVVRVDEVLRTWGALLGQVRQSLLNLPSRVAPLIPPEAPPSAVQLLIEREVWQILEELSRGAEQAEVHGGSVAC